MKSPVNAHLKSRHCERSAAIQMFLFIKALLINWIAALRSQ